MNRAPAPEGQAEEAVGRSAGSLTLTAVEAPAHAGDELERHTFGNTNGREDCKQTSPPKEFPDL